jgi:uncharacterized membrane protein YozB (DUF420 family)
LEESERLEAVAMEWTWLNSLSLLVWLILVAGFICRRHRAAHIPLMGSAMLTDLGMVLYLEIRRGVVESLPSREMTPLLAIHICVSVVVLVLYGVQVATGIRNTRGRRSAWHRRWGPLILWCRLGNLVTSLVAV